MARSVMLGNGSMLVGLNEQGLVHDFYYPYVGLENLTNARSVHHKIGVWVNGVFSWLDSKGWDISVDFDNDALVSNITAKHSQLQVELHFRDFVDHADNAFCRYIAVTNNADTPQEVRIFMHQVFQISQDGRADTAFYEPDEQYILDYKGRCSLLIYGQAEGGNTFEQFAIGSYGVEGKEGTYKDAEDGMLSGSAIEHGGVDSVIATSKHVEAKQTIHLEYWIVAADSQFTAERIHNTIKQDGLKKRLEQTTTYWHDWHAVGTPALADVDQKYIPFIRKSMMIIKAHIDKRGGIVASGDSSIYNYGRDYYSYVWPRDGAYAVWPLIRLGYVEEAQKFFAFCRDILTPDGYLMHKYQPDRAIGSTWHPTLHGNHKELPIQEDETASVIYMLGEYYEHSKDADFVQSLYLTLVQPASHFMSEFMDDATTLPHASYDLWEEKFLTNTYTAAITYQALLVAADFADMFEYPDDAAYWRQAAEKIFSSKDVFFDPERKVLRKGFLLQPDGSLQFDNTLDVSSMYGVMMYGLHKGADTINTTVAAIESILLNQNLSGGTPRYENDDYFATEHEYLGNPWIVTTLWMAQYYMRIGKKDKGTEYLDWAMSKALQSGMLSEQINPKTSSITSVTPLIWSHAEFINTALDTTKL